MTRFIKPGWPAPESVCALSSTRREGASSAPFNSLNFGHHVGDEAAALAANQNLLLAALPPGTQVQWLNQVHGTAVVEAGKLALPDADAAWSRDRGVACAVLTADCLPVLFCSTGGDVVAAAHAGWRGLAAGILESTVAAMGCMPEETMAWLGPAIGPDVFEVGAEVRESFLQEIKGRDAATVRACFVAAGARTGYYRADIYALARHRLQRLGIDRIYGGGFCTHTDTERFFSYRRDGSTGRMASVIVLN